MDYLASDFMQSFIRGLAGSSLPAERSDIEHEAWKMGRQGREWWEKNIAVGDEQDRYDDPNSVLHRQY